MPTCMSVYHLHFSYLLSDSLEMELKMVVGFYVDVGNYSMRLEKEPVLFIVGLLLLFLNLLPITDLFHLVCDDIITIVCLV